MSKASVHIRGDYAISMWHVEKVNGKEFKGFKEFYILVTETKIKFVVLEDEDGAKVVINKKEAPSIQNKILQRYGIKASVSDNLIDKFEREVCKTE